MSVRYYDVYAKLIYMYDLRSAISTLQQLNLRVIVSPEGIVMDPSKIQAILGWPMATKIHNLQSFLGFANFYQRFINNYSGIVIPLTCLLHKDTVWKWSPQCQEIFDMLKKAFTKAPVLQHYDPNHPITLKCDASDYAIAAILSQTNPTTNELHPITFYTHTMITAKLNYDIYNKELLMIHEAFKQWRVYLEGTWYEIQVFSDHNNLQYFTTIKQLSCWQAHWAEYLSSFNYVIHY
jgi:hypothetical protein